MLISTSLMTDDNLLDICLSVDAPKKAQNKSFKSLQNISMLSTINDSVSTQWAVVNGHQEVSHPSSPNSLKDLLYS
jgi:hypothetical protein